LLALFSKLGVGSRSPPLCADIGKDPSQEVTFDEFLKLVTPRMVSCSAVVPLQTQSAERSQLQGDRDSQEEINKVFKLFDEDNSGFITFRALKRVCQELGENLCALLRS
jgi:centrin-1